MQSVFEKIENLNGGNMRFGTGATRTILDRLGMPDEGLKIVHIAGTNGKGSVAEYITQILISAGKRVGTFTSPAAESYFEQFRINGENIERDRLASYFERAYAAAEGATAFEVQTAGAILAFNKEGCEYAVIECGLGGLLDATNAVNKKKVAVIASIALEHTAVLGETVEKICAHKAGIIKNCPAVVSALQPPEARKYFEKLKVRFADNGLKILESGLDGVKFSYGGNTYNTHICGDEQAYNAATAIEAAHVLGIEESAISDGIFKARLVARLQIIKSRGNTYIVDGGHNPAAMQPLARLLKRFDKNGVTLIFGCLSDKDICGNLRALEGCALRIIAVSPPSVRATSLNKITEVCGRYFPEVESAQSVGSALEKSAGTVAVCGSFTLVKEALNWIDREL